MLYGNQRVQTAVVTDLQRIHSAHDVLKLIEQFHARYGERFGKGSQAPEAGIRINTLRVCSYVEHPGIAFAGLKPPGTALRSEERRVGKECVSTFRSRVSP